MYVSHHELYMTLLPEKKAVSLTFLTYETLKVFTFFCLVLDDLFHRTVSVLGQLSLGKLKSLNETKKTLNDQNT